MATAWQRWLSVGMVSVWVAGSPLLGRGEEASSVMAATQPTQGEALLKKYDSALQSLPSLPNLQYRQQVRVAGTQEFTATLDVLVRQDHSWQAWLAEGDRIRLLDSQDLTVVDQSDLLQLYSVYVSDPEALIPEVGLRLAPNQGQYRVTQVQETLLDGKPVQHLILEGEGQLRELWLDPKSALPHQALLFLSGVWGQAYALLSFAAVENYWLPQATQINLGYGFWTLEGLSRRVFRGSLTIRHDYQNYQLLPSGTSLRFLPSQPPVDRPPQVAGIPTGSTVQAGDVQSLGTDSQGNEQFTIGLTQKTGEAILADRINAFNLTRPAPRNALTQIDTLASLPLGENRLPIYLFQFDTERPISPIQSGNPNRQADPKEVFAPTPPSIRIIGN
ncbi:MAG: hypothetical protein NW237_09055 [Cyanobacteriota bacterium]|nr:hypothetical protein [Cyanobacteriota bacterium]